MKKSVEIGRYDQFNAASVAVIDSILSLKIRPILFSGSITSNVSEVLVVAQAFVLVNAEVGSEDEVIGELRKISYVKESYVVYGAYDIVAKVEAESMNKLKDIVNGKIRRLDKVRSTLTMIMVE